MVDKLADAVKSGSAFLQPQHSLSTRPPFLQAHTLCQHPPPLQESKKVLFARIGLVLVPFVSRLLLLLCM